MRHLPTGCTTLGITLGHVILGQTAEGLRLASQHERVHVRQFERWGPLMDPPICSPRCGFGCAGKDAYRDNPFEVEAYRQAPDGSPTRSTTHPDSSTNRYSPMKSSQEKYALELVMRLMAIPGRSCEESLVAQAVVDELTRIGIPGSAISFDTAHRRTPQPGQVGNLIVRLPGVRQAPRLMLSAHLDTVPICVGCVPKRRGSVIYSANPHTGLGVMIVRA